jgi:hypothetical protein
LPRLCVSMTLLLGVGNVSKIAKFSINEIETLYLYKSIKKKHYFCLL